MEIKAYAKINLALNVVCRQDDGYHMLDMLMTPISLYDTLVVTKAQEDCFICEDTSLAFDEQNIIYKALMLLRERYSIDQKFKIELIKRIPKQAGLAGGSADGAAILKAVNQLCELGLSETELVTLGLQVGADVPFCLVNKISRVQGIGEHIKPLTATLDDYVLLVKPASGVSTKAAFEAIDFAHCVHPDIDKIERLMELGENVHSLLENTLEQPAMKLNQDILEVKRELEKWGFPCVLMSGSGSCVFALSHDLALLKQAQAKLATTYDFVEICTMK